MTARIKMYENMPALENVSDAPWQTTAIGIKPNSDLGHIATTVRDQCALRFGADMSTDTITRDATKMMVDVLSTERGDALCSELHNITMTIAAGVHDAFDLLRRTIQQEVSASQEQIHQLTNEYLNATVGVESITGTMITDPKQFDMVNWKQAELFGPILDTIQHLHNLANFTSTQAVEGNAGYIRDRLGEITAITLPAETMDTMVAQIAANCPTASQDLVEKVRYVLQLAIDPQAYHIYTNRNFHRAEVSNCTAQQMCRSYRHLTDTLPLVSALKKTSFTLTPETSATLTANINVLVNLTALAAYTLVVGQRKFKDTLVLDHNILNSEAYQAFSAQGGTLNDIANYIRMFYNQNPKDMLCSFKTPTPVPMQGVLAKEIMESRDRVRQTLEQRMETLKSKMSDIRTDALLTAYKQVLKKQVLNLAPEQIPAGCKPEQFTARAYEHIESTATILHQKDGNTEDALYEYILQTRYPGQLVNVLYHKLAKEYVRVVSQKQTLTDEDMIMADATVVAELVTEFLIENFVDKTH